MAKVPAGTYPAKVKNWWIDEVPSTGSLKVIILMTLNTGEVCRFESFVKTKDNKINKKLIKTLITCGYTGDTLEGLQSLSALNTSKELEVQVIEEGDYNRVEWINEPGGGAKPKAPVEVQKLRGMDLRGAFKETRKELGVAPAPSQKPVYNHAPGADNPPPSEDLPF